MTHYTNEASRLVYARVAGFTFLLYIAAGLASLSLAGQTQAIDPL